MIIFHLLIFNEISKDTSGLNFNEGTHTFTDTAKLLYNSKSSFQYAADRQRDGDSTWSPSSANPIVLNNVHRKLFKNDEDYWNSFNAFFDQINMNSLIVDTDAVGDFVTSAFAHATARDWARFGLFTLQRGQWAGKQVLPESWFDFALSGILFYFF